MAEAVFRAYDVRGIYGADLTVDAMEEVGLAMGSLLRGEAEVAVGRDARFSSPRLHRAVIRGVTNTGCEVLDIGFVPNPVNYFYAMQNKMYGAYVSASHSPVEYNGLKMIRPTGVSFIEENLAVKQIFRERDFVHGRGKVTTVEDSIESYEDFLSERFRDLGGLKVCVECMGGAGSAVTPRVFENLGLTVEALHSRPDGRFCGFERPEPKGENLKELQQLVKETRADYGVAFDGDADRSVFVDDRARELDGSRMTVVFLSHILEKKKGAAVVTVDCASEIEKLVQQKGGRIVWWRVGHGFVEEKCAEENAIFGGEQSSHFYSLLPDYPFSDGPLATIKAGEILKDTGKQLSELVDQFPLHPISKMYIDAGSDENKEKSMEQLRKLLSGWEDVMDGIKTRLNDVEWVLVRTSKTLPEINLVIEAQNEERMKELKDKYTSIIESVIDASKQSKG